MLHKCTILTTDTMCLGSGGYYVTT